MLDPGIKPAIKQFTERT